MNQFLQKITALAVCASLLCTVLNGQVNNGEISAISSSADVQICGSNSFTSISITALIGGLQDFQIGTNLPPGISYQASSVAILSAPAGFSITEFNIADLNAPVFEINGNWAAGDSLVFRFLRQGNCSAIPHDTTGGTFKDAFTVIYDNGSGTQTLTESDPNIANYDVNYAVLSILPIASILTNQGSNQSRNITIRQGGNGCTDSYNHFVVVGRDILNYQLQFGATTLLPSLIVPNTSATADTLFYNIDFSQSPFDTIGNADGCFDNGEELIFNESFLAFNCENTTIQHHASWGCAGASCLQASPQNGQVNFTNGVPNIILTQISAPALDMCGPVRYTVQIANTGLPTSPAGGAYARDVNVLFGLGINTTPKATPSANSLITHASRSWSNWTIGGNPVTISSLPAANSGTSAYIPADFFASDPDGAGTGFEDLDGDGFFDDLAAGESTTVSFDVTLDPLNKTCGLGYVYHAAFLHLYFDVNYNNQCSQPAVTKRTDLNYSAIARDYNAQTLLVGPTDVQAGEAFEFKILPRMTFWGSPQCSGGMQRWSVSLTLPAGVVLAPSASYDTTTHAAFAPTFVQNGNVVTYSINRYHHSWYPFDLQLDCAAWDGSTPIVIPFQTNYVCGDGSDTCWAQDIHCGEYSFYPHCPNPGCVGPFTTNFEASRTTPGYVDASKATLVDLTSGSYTDKMYFAADTMAVSATMLMQDTATENLRFRMTYNPPSGGIGLLSFVEGEVIIFDISKGSPDTIPINNIPTAYNLSGDIFAYDIDLSSSYYRDSVQTGYLYGEGLGDSVKVQARFVWAKSFSWATYHQLSDFRGSFYILDAASNELSCNSLGETAAYERASIAYIGAESNAVQTGCNDLRLKIRFTLNSGTGDSFAGEYRNEFELDSVQITIPANVSYTGTSLFDYDIIDPANPTNANLPYSIAGNILTIYPDSLMAYPDEGNNRHVVLWLYFQPDCDATSIDFNYTGYIERYSYHPNPTVQDQYIFSDSKTVTFTPPTFSLTTLDPIADGLEASESWDIQVCNTTTGTDIAYNWLAIDLNPNINIIAAYDLTGGSEQAIAFTTGANGTYVQLDTIGFSACKTIRIYATYSNCANQNLIAHHGWDCDGYPIDFSAVNYSCYNQDNLQLQPRDAQLQLNILSQPPAFIDLCTTVNYELEINSAQLADLVTPRLEMIMPAATGFNIISIEVEYPEGSGNTEFLSPIIIGNMATIDLLDHTILDSLGGVKGTGAALNAAERKAIVRIEGQTDCEFTSGASMTFRATSDRPCGEPAIGSGVSTISNKLNINGATAPYNAAMTASLSPAILESCGALTTVHNEVFITGGSTGGGDTAIVTLPIGLEYAANFICNSLDCPVFVGLDSLGGQQRVLFEYPAGVSTGFNFDFDARLTNAMDCAVLPILVQNTVTLPPLSCAGSSCAISKLETGSTLMNLDVQKPDVQIVAFDVWQASPTSAFSYSGFVSNFGGDLQAGESIEVELYCSDGAGGKASGLPVASHSINGPMVFGDSAAFSGSVAFGAGCNFMDGFLAVVEQITLNGTGSAQCICSNNVYEQRDLILPVEMLSFSAKEQDCKVHLDWLTASEEKLDFFQIERSRDGIVFEPVGKVAAKGVAYGNHYAFIDMLALPVAYYRLLAVNRDGSKQLSDIVVVNMNCLEKNTSVSLYPIPAENQISIDFEAATMQEISFEVLDALGRQIYSTKKAAQRGRNIIELPIKDWNSGIYWLRLQLDGSAVLRSFEKK